MRNIRTLPALLLFALAACQQTPAQRVDAARDDLHDAQENLSEARQDESQSAAEVKEAKGDVDAARAKLDARMKELDAQIDDLDARATSDADKQRIKDLRAESARVRADIDRDATAPAATDRDAADKDRVGTASGDDHPATFVDENHDGKDDRDGHTYAGRAADNADQAVTQLGRDIEKARQDITGQK